jgi:hypothetical protein
MSGGGGGDASTSSEGPRFAGELAAARAELSALRRELAAAQSAALTSKTDLDILSRKYSHLMAAKLEAEEQRDRCAGAIT